MFLITVDNFGFAVATFHGSDGEVTVSAASYAPLAKYFVRAAEEMGYPTVDLNSPYQEGTCEENVDHCLKVSHGPTKLH